MNGSLRKISRSTGISLLPERWEKVIENEGNYLLSFSLQNKSILETKKRQELSLPLTTHRLYR